MRKEEFIARYGEAAYARLLEQSREHYKEHKEEQIARAKKWNEEHREEMAAASKKYREKHPEQVAANSKKYREANPEKVKLDHQEQSRKGGRYYDKKLEDMQTGLQGSRNRIRGKHRRQYKPYKDIIALESQIHHEWVPETAEYRGVALVEADAHMHGFVNVIEILDGEITLLTEEEVKRGEKIEN